jgi:glycosyltransferase involved in cell wall biosynthesis
MNNPHLLMVSHVWPFPGSSGQQLRVRYTLEAAVRKFEVDFLTYAAPSQCADVELMLAAFGCRPVVLPSAESKQPLARLGLAAAAGAFALTTGLKTSNYRIGHVELSRRRIEAAIKPCDYDLVLYEYFHAVESVPLFRAVGVPSVLDMHNVLWKSLEQRLAERRYLPDWAGRSWLKRYRMQEEAAWRRFDASIAINRREQEMARACLGGQQQLFYAPMGTDLSLWPYTWQPATPPRLAYYGGLGSSHNQQSALLCFEQIMPRVWQRFPAAELWIVGSNPPERIRRLTQDPRIKVTGFVEQVQAVLCTMSLVLCPWSGTYGFRSRLVEVLALGVPVIATPDAVDGMELESGRGIILRQTDQEMATEALRLLESKADLAGQSSLARSEMERLYSLENTYGRLIRELGQWLDERKAHRPACPPVAQSTVPSARVNISAP